MRPFLASWIFALLLLASVMPAAAQHPEAVAALARTPAVRAAMEYVRSIEPLTIADQIRFCEVPAPPFKESARAEVLKRTFERVGLQNVRVDRVGNVLGDRPGASARPRLVIAAHLDTVFPEGTNVKVRRDGSMLRGPGISDDCRGLAVLVAIAKALDQGHVTTGGPITFVADVGEEGLGDLRGVKALFGDTLKGAIDRFVSIDGTGLYLTTVAVGSRRYRVTFTGPGGHSYGAFGIPSPIGALGRAIAKIDELQVVEQPRTTFNVGRIGGGTSVNAIAFDAWMEVDLRSVDQAILAALDVSVRQAIDRAVLEENNRWSAPGVIKATLELVGDRPGGALPEHSPLLETALAVGRALGLRVGLGDGSTDANLPISLGIPALTIGGGGRGGGVHALGEWFDSTESWKGTEHALLMAIALAQ
jgi:tripeptide aminopeptidase